MPDTHTHPNPGIDLSQINTRNTHARHIVAGCASALPLLADMWQALEDALSDTAALAAQVTRLSADLDRVQRDRANRLVAAPHPAALVGTGRDTGRRGRVGGGPVRRALAIPDAHRAHLRGHHDLRGRNLAFRRNRDRPVPPAASASAGNRRAYLVGAVVDP